MQANVSGSNHKWSEGYNCVTPILLLSIRNNWKGQSKIDRNNKTLILTIQLGDITAAGVIIIIILIRIGFVKIEILILDYHRHLLRRTPSAIAVT